MRRVVQGELLKIRTTNVIWLIGFCALVLAALAFLLHAVIAHDSLAEAGDRSAASLARMASGIYTSGQFFGLMFALLLGVLAMTNELYHRTATGTFLAVPKRGQLVAGKLVAVMLVAAGLWAFTTAFNIIAGVVFFDSEGVPNSLGHPEVTRSLVVNLTAYLLWATLGVGFGALVRGQVAAVVIGTAAYLLSMPWRYAAQLIVPSVASSLMVTAGTLVTRRRDIG